jgi:hypothetical protein
MFQLDEAEAVAWGGRRYAPYVFTEQGVAMLSGVLRSKRAIAVISRSCGRSSSCAARQLPLHTVRPFRKVLLGGPLGFRKIPPEAGNSRFVAHERRSRSPR